MSNDTTTIGAYATVYYKDEPDNLIEGVYFSFGDYLENEDTDSFGVNDLRIFFYAEGEEDMKSFMDADGVEDFVVTDYELEHQLNKENSK